MTNSFFVAVGWQSLIDFVKNNIINGSKEVALASINCLQTTVSSHSAKVIISPSKLSANVAPLLLTFP